MPINEVQTANRQHAVPQNVLDVEFKIVGDLTMRQFFYLLIFGGLAYVTFLTVSYFLKWPLILFFVFAGIAFAFLPIEERGLDQWVINFFRSIYTPQQRLWHKDAVTPAAFNYTNLDFVKQELITLTPTTSRRKLENFLEAQTETKVHDPLDIEESKFTEQLQEVYAHDTKFSMPSISAIFSNKQKTDVTEIIEEETEQRQAENQPDTNTKETAKKEPEAEKQKDAKLGESVKTKTKKIVKKVRRKRPVPQISSQKHSGRRFTNLLPSQGEIILPIRGERILKTTEEEKINEDLNTKTEQLQQLLDQIKKEAPHLQKQNNSGTTAGPASSSSTKTPQAFTELPQPNTEQAQKNPTIVPLDENKPKDPTFAEVSTQNSTPNTVSGIVLDADNKPLQGIVLIIKNEKDEPVRALKSDQLGQFNISTPLSNGIYNIETDKAKKTNYTFDIIRIVARGTAIAPIKIVGRA